MDYKFALLTKQGEKELGNYRTTYEDALNSSDRILKMLGYGTLKIYRRAGLEKPWELWITESKPQNNVRGKEITRSGK